MTAAAAVHLLNWLPLALLSPIISFSSAQSADLLSPLLSLSVDLSSNLHVMCVVLYFVVLLPSAIFLIAHGVHYSLGLAWLSFFVY